MATHPPLPAWDTPAAAAPDALLAEALRCVPQGVLLLDAEARITWVNDAWVAMCGFAREAMQGRVPGEFCDGPATDPESVAQVREGLASAQAFSLEMLSYRADGSTYWASTHWTPLGAGDGFVCTITDVTARRRAEDLQREVLDALPAAILAFDAGDRLILANTATEAMFGTGRADLGERLDTLLARLARRGQMTDAAGDPAQSPKETAGRYARALRDGLPQRLRRLPDGRVMHLQEAVTASGTLVAIRLDVTALEQERAETLLQEVLNALPVGVFAFDEGERLAFANEAVRGIVPVPEALVEGALLESIVRRIREAGGFDGPAASGAATADAAAAAHVASVRAGDGVPRLRHQPDGRVFQLRDIRTPSGRLVCVRTDVTDLDRERQARERAEALLRDVLDAVPVAVFAFDAQERLVFANAAHLGMVHGAAQWRPGASLERLLRIGLSRGGFSESGNGEEDRARFAQAHLAAMRAGDGSARLRRLADGRVLLMRDTRAPSGTLVCVRTDVTELDRAQAALRQRAERCQLTGLANRAMLLERLAAAAQDGVGTLLMFDLDHFKQVNDTLGHGAGDALLAAVAERLRGAVRASDLPARLGGDEFAVVMPGLAGEAAVMARMAALQAALSVPLQLGGRRVEVSLSAGLAAWPADGADAAALLKHADLALYESKRAGRNRWSSFRPEQAVAAERQARLAAALRAALAGKGAAPRVALQPKRRIGGGHQGFEALARWEDAAGAPVAPFELVAAAEEAGLGPELGRVIFDHALGAVRALRGRGVDPGPVAVNVGSAQLRSPGFVAEVTGALLRHGLAPADLEVEVTENVVLGRGGDQAEAVLAELRATGIALALDDFGTGFASLSHLARLPLDRLKVDRSFVAGVGRPGGERGEVIAKAVIGLARALGLETVAEGVETAAQLDFLEAQGCDIAQGWLIGRPLDGIDSTEAYLRGLAGSGRALRRAGGRAPRFREW